MDNTKKLVIFSNWKIYMRSRQEVRDFVEGLRGKIKPQDFKFLEIFIIPDLLSFEFVKGSVATTGIKVGVQDLFWEDYGSFAGEVAPAMLKDLGCDCAYFGHSERRIYFGETDDNINKKIKAALRNDIIPILYIGETREELDKNLTEDVLKTQLDICLKDIDADSFKKTIIVYEPRWAIGQENSASADIISYSHVLARELIADIYGKKTASETRIMYGGSINEKNIHDIIRIADVDGAAITRAALNAEGFIKLIRIVREEAEKRNQRKHH
jgi:triosephosphate isomerase